MTSENKSQKNNASTSAQEETRKVIIHQPPETIYEFRKINQQDEYAIPENFCNRKCTDVFFLVLFILFVLGYIGCVIRAAFLVRLDIYLGYDKCGNICGKNNKYDPEIPCSGQNLTDKKYMSYSYHETESNSYMLLVEDCVSFCPKEKGIMIVKRCYMFSNNETKTFILAQSTDFIGITIREFIYKNNGKYILATTGFGIACTLSITMLFSTVKTSLMLKIVYYLSCFLQIILSAFFFTMYFLSAINSKTIKVVSFLTPAVILGLGFVVNLYLHVHYRHNFELCFRFIQEALDTVRQVPQTMFQPFITIIFQVILINICLAITFLMPGCYNLVPTSDPTRFDYKPSSFVIGLFIYNAIFFLWLFFFSNGCEYMILTGAYAPFYFTKDTSTVKPLFQSYAILWNFHLGTVALGSLCVPFFSPLRFIVHEINNHLKPSAAYKWYKCLATLAYCCIKHFHNIVEYISERTYVETVLHGTSFCKSGRRAVRLLWANLLTTLSIRVIIKTMLVNFWILLTLLPIAVGILIELFVKESPYFYLNIFLGALITCFFASSICHVLDIVISTIFMCFCEDQLLNDGVKRPYFISKEISDLIEEAKEFDIRRKEHRNLQ